MKSLRPEYTEQEMISAVRSKCSDVKKAALINERKRTQSQMMGNISMPSTSFGAKRRTNLSLNGHASILNHTSNELNASSYANGVSIKNEIPTSNFYQSNASFLDESSSEYFQQDLE